jgi:hypothetical protein
MEEKEVMTKLAIEINNIPKKYPEKKDGSHLFNWYNEIDKYKKQILKVIIKSFGESSPYIEELNKISLPTYEKLQQDYTKYDNPLFAHHFAESAPGSFYFSFAVSATNLLEVIASHLEETPTKKLDYGAVDLIHNICDKFNIVAEQLEKRHDKRESIRINDEYDVQDLFHSLLHLYFDDIRDEDSMPSFAGISSRIDFLLSKEKIGIEIKKTGSNLKCDKLRTQLSEDIVSYEKHPEFNILIFFVYDHEKLIGNPRGFESDFNKEDQNRIVRVFIRPN